MKIIQTTTPFHMHHFRHHIPCIPTITCLYIARAHRAFLSLTFPRQVRTLILIFIFFHILLHLVHLNRHRHLLILTFVHLILTEWVIIDGSQTRVLMTIFGRAPHMTLIFSLRRAHLLLLLSLSLNAGGLSTFDILLLFLSALCASTL